MELSSRHFVGEAVDMQAHDVGRFDSPGHNDTTRAAASRLDVVERAEAYVRAHMDTPVACSELCRAVGLSERGLRSAFHRVRGMSPKQYMLAERLLQARRALCTAPAGSATVTTVATNCGFYELGRFAATYRAAFGEAPSETLRKRAGARRSARVDPKEACACSFKVVP